MYSIQQAAQDAVSVSKVLERLLLGIGETAPETVVNVLLESNSASALQLIHGVDIPKKLVISRLDSCGFDLKSKEVWFV